MRVMSAPMKVGQGTESSLRFIKGKRPRIFGNTEMDLGSTTAIPLIRKVFGRNVRIFTKDLGGHSQEIPVVLRSAPWIKVLHFDLLKLSDDMGAAAGGMGNDRWLARVVLKVWRRRWVYYYTHVNAGVQKVSAGPGVGQILKNKEGQARWEVYQDQMRQIEEDVSADIKNPVIDVVVIGGDFNMLPVGDGLREHHSPHKTFERLGMTYVNTRVNYLAVHGARIRRNKVYPAGQNGWFSDHSALMAWIR